MLNNNYNCSITIFNKLNSKDSTIGKEKWQRTNLVDCFYKAETAVFQSNTEASKDNTYTVRIPQSEYYLPYNEWKLLSDGEREKYFTLSIGDIIVGYECYDFIDGSSGNTATQVLNNHKPNAFKITSISDNTRFPFGKHYRLGG